MFKIRRSLRLKKKRIQQANSVFFNKLEGNNTSVDAIKRYLSETTVPFEIEEKMKVIILLPNEDFEM